jgi:hypothetical protein
VVTHWVWGGGFLAKGKDYGGDIGQIAYQVIAFRVFHLYLYSSKQYFTYFIIRELNVLPITTTGPSTRIV